jgi:hypothetical protein
MFSARASLTQNPYLWLSLGLFILCLCFSAYDVGFPSGERSDGRGFHLLLVGWMGVLAGIPAWLANPVLVLAWYVALRRMHQLSFILSLVALVLMLSFLAVSEVEGSASGQPSPVTGYGVGYWLWVASALAQGIGASVLSRNQPRGPRVGVDTKEA